MWVSQIVTAVKTLYGLRAKRHKWSTSVFYSLWMVPPVSRGVYEQVAYEVGLGMGFGEAL